VLYGLDRAVPHVHARFAEPGHTLDPRRRQALLLVSALTIHNVPEGMADLGVPIALAIGSRTSRRASPPPRRCR
jgi:zinc transporter ZupT